MQREQQFVDRLYVRLDELRAEREENARRALAQLGNSRQAKLERDITADEQARSAAELAGVESGLCFGRIDHARTEGGGGGHHHIGRIGIRADDAARTPLLIDWRAPVARPFYLATGHTPMGIRRRRHLTTEGRTVTELHDEILDLDDPTRTGFEGHNADEVLLAALNTARTGRMGDIVQTIQAEQDRIIRAPHRGVMVVEGGPGTGKTAVALHRAAYLLYAERELLAKRAVLIVGPNPAFLGYIGEVLPSLGETGVLLSTIGELYPGVHATGTDTPAAAAVKGRADMAGALAAVVRDRQSVPDPVLEIDHDDYGTLYLERAMAEDARARARTTRLPHNLARPYFVFALIDALTEQLVDRLGADPFGGPNLLGPDDMAQIGKEIATSSEVHAAIDSLWPPLSPQGLVAEFLQDPRGYVPDADAEAIRRAPGAPWTEADVPLLDEAAELLGIDDSAERAAKEAERQQQIEYAQGVLDMSYASRTYEFEDKEESDEDAAEVLAAHDIIDAERMAERQEEADHRTAAERAAADRTWAFGHIIVDEAQELSPMAWRLLMRRIPTRSLTLVGDPAQTGSEAGVGTWADILTPYVEDRWEMVRLGVNYRTPAEIMDVAADVLRAESPGFEPPRSVRSTGVRPWVRRTDDLAGAVAEAVARELPEEGRLAVIAPRGLHAELAEVLDGVIAGAAPDLTHQLVLLDARQSKGLEFDKVVVVEPAAFRTSDLYVALTRATQGLGVVHSRELPFAEDGLSVAVDCSPA
ncbi:HelD family protein [Streptomyces luteolus]|uniref:AAA family ATPase n=1 Tax=Streptomyces luteolus TaxID=3043615 RepID=A0ABT6SNS1_9ACTN|nr:UvrD-helicase domain-containing protein [Streptomyces sp. B-S-A12]MDI3417262.1 AAA family ATPase [Streptomyces sp. B-S-A12]